MKNKLFIFAKLIVGRMDYPFTKLGYSKKISEIDHLPKSHFYDKNTFFDALFGLHHSFLKSSGWLESKSRNQSSRNGKPMPWITYPSFEYLDSMCLENLRIVEIGAGASTLYFEERAIQVTSYEFDAEYFDTLIKGRKSNTSIRGPINFRSTNTELEIEESFKEFLLRDIEAGEISNETAITIDWSLIIQDIKQNIASADIIFIDGGPRTLVAQICAEDQNRSRLVVLDNSDREYEKFSASLLSKSDYIEIPFTGLGPLNPYSWTTSFFVREIETLRKFKREKM